MNKEDRLKILLRPRPAAKFAMLYLLLPALPAPEARRP